MLLVGRRTLRLTAVAQSEGWGGETDIESGVAFQKKMDSAGPRLLPVKLTKHVDDANFRTPQGTRLPPSDMLSPSQRLKRFAKQQSGKGFFAQSPALTPRSSPHFKRALADRRLRSPREALKVPRAAAGDGAEGGTMTAWQAGFNVVNLYVGMGLLSKPYALALGGWFSLLPLFVLCAISLYTGKVIVRCFAWMRTERPTYPMLGAAAFGRAGEALVSVMIFLEFFGATCIVLLFLWQNASLLLDGRYELWQIALAVLGCTLPTVWMVKFSDLAFLSVIGFLSSLSIAIVIIGVLLSDTGRVAKQDLSTYGTGMDGQMQAIGINMISLAGHACLPSIYTQMAKPEQFERMLDASFVVMLLVYLLVAVSGYLAYGSGAAVLVTENLSGWPSKLLLVFVIINCFCSVAPVVTVLSELPENALGLGDDDADDGDGGRGHLAEPLLDGGEGGGDDVAKGSLARWLARGGRARKVLAIRLIRTLALVMCSALAYACKDLLADVEALVGSIASMSTTIILPSMCYLQLSRMAPDTSLSACELGGNALIVTLGLITTVVVTAGALKDMTG